MLPVGLSVGLSLSSFWSVLGTSWERPGTSGKHLGTSWESLRPMLGQMGRNFILSGASWVRLGRVLAPSCGHLGSSWARLVRILAHLGRILVRLGSVFDASCSHFGRS